MEIGEKLELSHQSLLALHPSLVYILFIVNHFHVIGFPNVIYTMVAVVIVVKVFEESEPELFLTF